MYIPTSKGPGAAEGNPELRLRTMRILWVMFLITIGLFFLVARLSRPEADAEVEGVPPVLYVFGALGLTSIVASFILKSSFYRRAVEQQSPQKLQEGFIIALVLCEACVLFGLTGLFATQCSYAYALFPLGALGELLHFPRREQLMSAYFKPGM